MRIQHCRLMPTLVLAISTLLHPSFSQENFPADEEAAERLVDFRDGIPGIFKSTNSKIRLVPFPGRESPDAVLVETDSNHQVSGVSIQPDSPWNWSEKKEFGFAIDIANVGEISAHLYVEIASHGDSQVRGINIPADGEVRTYYAVLDGDELKIDSGLRDGPDDRQFAGRKLTWLWGEKSSEFAMEQITEVSIYCDTTLHNRQFIVGNIRLIANPPLKTDSLTAICDRFGQNNKVDFPMKVKSEAELKSLADAERAELENSHPMPDRSKFGGWTKGPKLKATGYFRTEKVGGRWALVDPEGYLFFSTGIANVRLSSTTTLTGVDFKRKPRVLHSKTSYPEDSKPKAKKGAAGRAVRFTASELRTKMFTWLPENDSRFSDHYSYTRKVHTGPMSHGENISFYRVNLERRYGQSQPNSYLDTWRDVTVARMLDWGFTSFGNWTDEMFYHVEQIPYFANGWITGKFKTIDSGNDYWSPMPDPFDPEFVRRARITTTSIANKVKRSPWCIGVFIDNEKGWGRMGSFESQYGIVINALGRDASECPTKAAFVKLLEEKYKSVQSLNDAWDIDVSSWDEFARPMQVDAQNAAVVDDFSKMLYVYAAEYFRVVHDSLQAVLPNHLYMGVRMAHWGMTPEVRAAAGEHSDVISYNFYKEGIRADDWKFLAKLDMPSIIGEFHMGAATDSGLFHPGLIMADDQTDRARMYLDYMNSVIDNPYFVGAHWFQYIDSPLTGRGHDGENYNAGFVRSTDIPYSEMVTAAKELHRGLYPRCFGDVVKQQPQITN